MQQAVPLAPVTSATPPAVATMALGTSMTPLAVTTIATNGSIYPAPADTLLVMAHRLREPLLTAHGSRASGSHGPSLRPLDVDPAPCRGAKGGGKGNERDLKDMQLALSASVVADEEEDNPKGSKKDSKKKNLPRRALRRQRIPPTLSSSERSVSGASIAGAGTRSWRRGQ